MIRLAIAWGLAKAAFMTALVTSFAAAEPFWHQAILVLGSASITATAVIIAAWIGAKRVERTVQETHQAVADLKKGAGVARRDSDP